MLYKVAVAYPSDTASLFTVIADLPWAIWLDSGGRGRYDILVALPVVTLETKNGQTSITDPSGKRKSAADPFDLIRESMGLKTDVVDEVQFAGGALGYWGYDLNRVPDIVYGEAGEVGQPAEMAIGIYDWAIQLDHQQKSAVLLSHKRYPETEQNIQQVLNLLNQHTAPKRIPFYVYGKIRSNFNLSSYREAFWKIQDYLKAGDCYQVNLAQRFSVQASGDSIEAYCALRKISPAPYSAFLNLPQVQILCTSPELFLSVKQGVVETRPIKGTRPCVPDAQQNAQLLRDLQNNPKDRAENLMIVDLLRNDLSKNCLPGSVKVPKLFEVESFATVHHLVSTVTGKLAAGKDALALLRDCFPGGSVTGAPKLRAMEIIKELEPHQRGVYCGSVGYIGFDGNMSCNIAIRSLIYADGVVHCWAGGGVVADSDAGGEYQETLDKAKAMLELFSMYGAVGFVNEGSE